MNTKPKYDPSTTLLLEQYKLFVEMTDRNSERRGQTNKFYITILTGLLAITSWAATTAVLCDNFDVLLLLVSILGLILCLIWFLNINSYKQMSQAKFTVILEMEKQLAFPCFSIIFPGKRQTPCMLFGLPRSPLMAVQSLLHPAGKRP